MATPLATNETLSHYDDHIIPGEIAARAIREGKLFGHVRHDSDDPEAIHICRGYTVDQEGLINNFAIEPQMYINEPGDLIDEQIATLQQRVADLKALEEEEDGKLTMGHDLRHKGPGLI